MAEAGNGNAKNFLNLCSTLNLHLVRVTEFFAEKVDLRLIVVCRKPLFLKPVMMLLLCIMQKNIDKSSETKF